MTPVLVNDILSVIPQRPPFVMIDDLVSSDDIVTRTKFLVKAENILLNNDRLSEAGMVENMAQSAAARAGYQSKMANKPVSIGYIGSVNNLMIYSLPAIADELETEINIVNEIFNVTLISGKILCKGELLAQCDMKIFITQPK